MLSNNESTGKMTFLVEVNSYSMKEKLIYFLPFCNFKLCPVAVKRLLGH